MRVALVSAGINESAYVSRISHVVQISNPVKLVNQARRVAKTMDLTTVGSPVQRI